MRNQSNWNLRAGFDGSLQELFLLMAPFYPRLKDVAAVQRWLLKRAATADETFICRMHAGAPRGSWVPGGSANAYLTSDNEFAASIFGLTFAGEIERLTKGSLYDALAIPGVRLCWAFGRTFEEQRAVVESHRRAGIATQLPTGGTSLYPARSLQRLKLAHLAPAADAINTLPIDETERRRIRMFRSVNPLNMYPLPQAGHRFQHTAEWRGTRLPLRKNDLGETDDILDCILALLEERYREEGFADDFALYVENARLEVASLNMSSLRQKSRELRVTITPRTDGAESKRGSGASADAVLTYEEFKAWAQDTVRKYGNQQCDFFVCGEPTRPARSFPAPIVRVRLDGFDDDNGHYNAVYRVANDTRVSALAYFLLLDERHHGDCNAIFRPDLSRTGGSLKPLLAFSQEDLPLVPHLALYRGEVKGWNVLSP
jgi:hypothetical protein